MIPNPSTPQAPSVRTHQPALKNVCSGQNSVQKVHGRNPPGLNTKQHPKAPKSNPRDSQGDIPRALTRSSGQSRKNRVRNHHRFSCATCAHRRGPKYKHTALSCCWRNNPGLFSQPGRAAAAGGSDTFRVGHSLPPPPPRYFYSVCGFMNEALTVPKTSDIHLGGRAKISLEFIPRAVRREDSSCGMLEIRQAKQHSQKKHRDCAAPLVRAEGFAHTPHPHLSQKLGYSCQVLQG